MTSNMRHVGGLVHVPPGATPLRHGEVTSEYLLPAGHGLVERLPVAPSGAPVTVTMHVPGAAHGGRGGVKTHAESGLDRLLNRISTTA